MANEIQFDLGNMNFGGMDFGGMDAGASVEQLLSQLDEMFSGLMGSVDQIIKDEYRTQLNEAALASGGASDGVITERESELIEKAVNGTITSEEKEELLSYFPPSYSDTSGNSGDLSDLTVDELIYLVSQPLSPDSAAAATELRNRASVDGYVSPELNALLNKARLNGGLTESEQLRLYRLLQEEDGL